MFPEASMLAKTRRTAAHLTINSRNVTIHVQVDQCLTIGTFKLAGVTDERETMLTVA